MTYDLYSQLESFTSKLTMNTMSFLMKCGEMMRLEKGEVLSREGEDSEHVYMIIEGVAGIEKIDGMGNKMRIAQVESGGLIGEMGVFLNRKRTATVVADTDLALIKFTNENFINALPKTPDITVRLLKSLAQKVNEINLKYSESAKNNGMFMVGFRLLDHPMESTELEINVKKMCMETGLQPGAVVGALKNFLKEGLIGKWELSEGTIVKFPVDLPKLKAYLTKLGV